MSATLVLLAVPGCGAVQKGVTEALSEGTATGSPSTPGSSSRESSAMGAGASQPDPSAGSQGAPGDASAGRGAGKGSGPSYQVVSIVDGDTIKVRMDGRKEAIRIIGLDTPETKKPHTPVQCFGKEATSHMQSLVQSRTVQLEAEPSQGSRDKYNRLLRHVFVGGDRNVALDMIAGGFAKEYTYDGAYTYQRQYQAAMNQAKSAKRGLWGPPCNGFHKASGSSSASSSASASGSPKTSATGDAPGGCKIKGNINGDGKKLAHLPGSRAYARTTITTSKGERWFCSEAEATSAGWRVVRD